MIYTSYFAKLRRIPDTVMPISIALFDPKAVRMFRYPKLNPTREILAEWKKDPNEARYRRDYKQQILCHLSPAQVVSELYEGVPTKDIVLVCYEKSGDFCHRHLVSKWLNEAGFSCEEWEE